MCTGRDGDPISTTLKVITLIKAVMCEDRRGEGRREGGGGRERAIFYGAAWGVCDLRDRLCRAGREGGTGRDRWGSEKHGVSQDESEVLLLEERRR